MEVIGDELSDDEQGSDLMKDDVWSTKMVESVTTQLISISVV